MEQDLLGVRRGFRHCDHHEPSRRVRRGVLAAGSAVGVRCAQPDRSPRPTSSTTRCPARGRCSGTPGRVSYARARPQPGVGLGPGRHHRRSVAGLRRRRPDSVQTPCRSGPCTRRACSSCSRPAAAEPAWRRRAMRPKIGHSGRVRRWDRRRHLRNRGRVESSDRSSSAPAWPSARVAPAALASTFVTSIVGVTHLRGPAAERVRIDRPGLVARRCVRARWVVWWLPRSFPATPDAREGCSAHSSDSLPSAWQRCTRFRPQSEQTHLATDTTASGLVDVSGGPPAEIVQTAAAQIGVRWPWGPALSARCCIS